MICDLCGKAGARIQRVTNVYGKGKDLLVVENVPVVRCPSCRERYYTAETLRTLEEIRFDPERHTVRRLVPVAQFSREVHG